jgi:hypothetical protein
MMIFSTFFGESSQTHEGSSTGFLEFLRLLVRFDFRIKICAGVQFIKRASDQKTDPTVLFAAALGYNVKKPAIQQDPWLRR